MSPQSPDSTRASGLDQLDYRATSHRPQWHELPDAVRDAVIGICDASVSRAYPSVTSGFTGAFAAMLELDDGREVFAKAGSSSNPHLVQAYRQEARVLVGLPDGTPAPRPVGAATLEAGRADQHAWQVVIMEAVHGRMPLPWTETALDAVHHACLRSAEVLTPAPPAIGPLSSLAQDMGGDETILTTFTRLASGELTIPSGQPKWLPTRLADLDALLDDAALALAGDTATHGDLRADNVLIRPDGRAVLLDWNWLSLGPAWTDFVGVLPPARAEGLEVDAWVAGSPLTRDVDPQHIDCWLAVIAAYMLGQADQPLWPGALPAIRDHQRYYARVFLDWLAARRHWVQ